MKHTSSSKRPFKLVALTLLAALASACQTTTASGPHVQTEMLAQAPFAHYQTFSFGLAEGPPSGSTRSAGSLSAERHLTPLVGVALGRKGYAQNAGKADFVVRIGTGMANLPDDWTADFLEDFAAPETMPGLSLAIDVYDAATGAHVWHGATVVTLDQGNLDDKLLERVVASAFAEFPDRDPAGGSPDALLSPLPPVVAPLGTSSGRL